MTTGRKGNRSTFPLHFPYLLSLLLSTELLLTVMMDCLLFAGVRCRFFRFFASVWRRILKVGGELKDNDWKQNETKNNKVLNWDIIVDVVNPFTAKRFPIDE